MYLTPQNKLDADFDWELYFNDSNEIENLDAKEIFLSARNILKENKISMTFSASKLLRNLLKKTYIPDNPAILELGAASGFLSRWLVSSYSGHAILVDKGENSYKKFLAHVTENQNLEYIQSDLFDLPSKLNVKFDIVCSFGLIEHFENKKELLEMHHTFLKENGYILILVPEDTYLTRVYYELHPELNRGYRELLSKSDLKNIMTENGYNVLELGSSSEYVYDFVGILCQLK